MKKLALTAMTLSVLAIVISTASQANVVCRQVNVGYYHSKAEIRCFDAANPYNPTNRRGMPLRGVQGVVDEAKRAGSPAKAFKFKDAGPKGIVSGRGLDNRPASQKSHGIGPRALPSTRIAGPNTVTSPSLQRTSAPNLGQTSRSGVPTLPRR
jgi:hypothetical protein